MTIKNKTIKKIFPAIILSLCLSSPAFANEAIKVTNEDYSIYRYNALQNKISLANLVTTIDTGDNRSEKRSEQLPEINELKDDITKKLEDITEKQNFSIEKINAAINNLEHRSGIRTFLIGNSLGTLKFQSAQIKDQASILDNLALHTEDSTKKIQISNQAKFLKGEQIKVEDFILKKEKEFSLFGWFIEIL